MAGEVSVQGLAELRKSFRAMDAGLAKELGQELKGAAAIVAEASRLLAPKRSGKLAGSIRPGISGTRAFVRSPLVYANVQHWGGNVGRLHHTHIRGTEFITRALEAKQDAVIDRIGQGIEDLAARNGWH